MSFISSLSARERGLLSAMGLLAILLMFYMLLWEPTQLRLNDLRERQLPQSEQTLAWVKQALVNAENNSSVEVEKIIEGPLLTVIEQTAEKAKVRSAIQRMQPNQNQQVKIWMNEVEFDSWLRWVALLQQQNVEIDRASVATNTPGLVNVRMTVVRR